MFPSFDAAYVRGDCQRQPQDILPRVRTESWRCPAGVKSWVNYSAWYSWRPGFDHYESKYGPTAAVHGAEFISYPTARVGNTAGALQSSRIFADHRLAMSVTVVGTSQAEVEALFKTVHSRPTTKVHMGG